MVGFFHPPLPTRSTQDPDEPEISDEIRGRCYADKGYTGNANRTVVHQKGFKDGIMEKAVRGKVLGYWQKIRNKRISSVRYGIERIFGTFKRCRNFSRSRYVGQAGVEQEFFLIPLSCPVWEPCAQKP
ncbi:MAG: transposase [Desulfovibrio sp.]|nr:transposase [Desulfovibrio sp.]